MQTFREVEVKMTRNSGNNKKVIPGDLLLLSGFLHLL